MISQAFSSPLEVTRDAIPIFTEEFARHPHRVYQRMREQYGPLVPVEIMPGIYGTMVIGYREAVEILSDDLRFSSDPRPWHATLPPETRPTHHLQYRPCAFRLSGPEHTRLRRAYVESLPQVNLLTLQRDVEILTLTLVERFAESGTAELSSQFSIPLAFQLVNQMLGFTMATGGQLMMKVAEVRGAPDMAAENKANEEMILILMEELARKRAAPADDITSVMLRHPAGLDDEELAHQVVMLFGAGVGPLSDLILNTLLLMLTDPRFGGDLLGGALSVPDAIDEVLFQDPPLINVCLRYPVQPILVRDVWLPAHQPVMVSAAAATGDPAVIGRGERFGNRSHLAWGAGPHVCPMQDPAQVIVRAAVEQLLDLLPELELAQPAESLTYRMGGFLRSLDALPVRFQPTPISVPPGL